MDDTKNIALFYFHVASNIGDLAINEGVLSIINKLYPKNKIKCYILDGSNSPHIGASQKCDKNLSFCHVSGKRNNPLFFSMRPEKILNQHTEPEKFDLVIINSGEHYFQYLHGENTYSLFWRLLPALAVVEKNVPLILFPSTVGPFQTPDSREFFEHFIGVCSTAFVRDLRSLNYVKKNLRLGEHKKSKIRLALDPAFFLNYENNNNKNGEPPFPSTETVALIMRLEDWGIRINDKKRKEKNKRHIEQGFSNSISYKFSCSLIEKILETTEKSVVLFTQTLADKKLNFIIHEKYSTSGRVFHYQPTSVDDYLQKLNQVDNIVSSRLHALILGMVVGKFPHGVYFNSHGPKMPGLFSMLAIDNHCRELSSDNINIVAEETLQDLMENKEQELKLLTTRLVTSREKFMADLQASIENLDIDKNSIETFRAKLIDIGCALISTPSNKYFINDDARMHTNSATESGDLFIKHRTNLPLLRVLEHQAIETEKLMDRIESLREENTFLRNRIRKLESTQLSICLPLSSS